MTTSAERRRAEISEVQAGLTRLIRATESLRAREAAKSGIGVTEMRALARLVERGSATPKELSASLELSTGATTALIDRMESLGVIVRRPHAHDRRSLVLFPTERGDALIEGIRTSFVGAIAAALDEAGDTELRRLAGELGAVATRFEQTP